MIERTLVRILCGEKDEAAPVVRETLSCVALTLVLVDRADAETVPALQDGVPLPNRIAETARVAGVTAAVVIVAVVALVPTVTDRLGAANDVLVASGKLKVSLPARAAGIFVGR